MHRSRIVEALRAQRLHCEGRSPFYVEILRELEADARAAPWVERLEQAWRGRRFAVDWEAAHLLLAAMHHAALAGEAPELAALYPSCGGSGGEPRGAASAFLARAPRAFWARLSGALVQTNEVGRSVAWMVAAAAELGGAPFHLVELGSSAGLNLAGDHVPQACRFVPEGAAPAGWNRPHAVLTRAGLDLHPLHLEHAEDRLWLKACVWADDAARLARLDIAMEAFLSLRPQIELCRCSFDDAPEWLLAHRRPAHGEALLVFNAIGTVYLDDDAYGRLARGMARALAPWQGRAIWVEYERPRDAPGAPLEIAVRRPAAGGLETTVIASGAPRPTELRMRVGEPSCRSG